MNVLRYVMVIIIGSIAGLLWGTILVDFFPQWFESLPFPLGWLFCFLPLIIHFVCGICVDWCDWPSMSVYTLVVLCWWIIGSIRNELLWVGNLSHVTCEGQIKGLIILAGLLVGSWKLGRILRNRHRAAPAQ